MFIKPKVGLVTSSFDLLHAGHVLFLKEAKDNCDYLIAALHIDPSTERESKHKPVQSLLERQIQIWGTRYVDHVIVYETEKELLEILKSINIDIRFLGEDYLNKDFTGKTYCLENNIEIYYAKRQHDYSSSGLIRKIKDV